MNIPILFTIGSLLCWQAVNGQTEIPGIKASYKVTESHFIENENGDKKPIVDLGYIESYTTNRVNIFIGKSLHTSINTLIQSL